jgi:hypothetical protein
MRFDPCKLGAFARSLYRFRNLAGKRGLHHLCLETPYRFILPDQDGFPPLAEHKLIIPISAAQSIASNGQAELRPPRHLAPSQITALTMGFAYPIIGKAD